MSSISGVRLAEKFELVVWRATGGSKYRAESQDQQQKTSAEAGEADIGPFKQTLRPQETSQSLEGLRG